MLDSASPQALQCGFGKCRHSSEKASHRDDKHEFKDIPHTDVGRYPHAHRSSELAVPPHKIGKHHSGGRRSGLAFLHSAQNHGGLESLLDSSHGDCPSDGDETCDGTCEGICDGTYDGIFYGEYLHSDREHKLARDARLHRQARDATIQPLSDGIPQGSHKAQWQLHHDNYLVTCAQAKLKWALKPQLKAQMAF